MNNSFSRPNCRKIDGKMLVFGAIPLTHQFSILIFNVGNVNLFRSTNFEFIFFFCARSFLSSALLQYINGACEHECMCEVHEIGNRIDFACNTSVSAIQWHLFLLVIIVVHFKYR